MEASTSVQREPNRSGGGGENAGRSSVVATVSTERSGVRGAAVHNEPVLSHLLSLSVWICLQVRMCESVSGECACWVGLLKF